MKLLKCISLILILVLLSCGDDNNKESVEPDPAIPTNKFPAELVGTWQFYSGNPVAVLSSVEENDILNQTFIFVANGNMNEAIVRPDRNKQGETISANGNWFVENKQLKLTDWQGNMVGGNVAYKINSDSSLTLTISGKSAVYFKQDEIKKKYPSLIVSTWNSLRQDGGRTRMIFSSNGKGAFLTTYIDGAFYGRGDFTWSYSDNVITAIYENRASSFATEEYVLNYLNKKSISWTFKNNIVHYVREQ